MYNIQRLSPDSTKTLLDYHLATFDGWLQTHFMPLSASSQFHYTLPVITLLDQLDPEEYKWERISVILQHLFPFVSYHSLNLLIGEMSTTCFPEFFRILSKFLMDRERVGFCWINSHDYADLARYILEFLRDK
jgi:hypothetical protein